MPRSSLRSLSRVCVAVAVFAAVFVLAPPAYAATITVNTLDDELNSDGDCSLREAISAANTNAASDACASGQAAPTVDVIDFSVTGTITLTSGQLTIFDNLTIDGPGEADLTISGNYTGRVFEVGPGVNHDLEGVTVANGGSGGIVAGGGIYNAGTLSITNSTFSGNSAGIGGGGIRNIGGTLTVTNSTFSGNSAGTSAGGGIYQSTGTATVTNSTFSGNSSGFGGGGIFNESGTLTVTNSTFSGNSAPFGGGISGRFITITNSTFSGNSAGTGGGGGIGTFATTLTLRNTIVANSPSGGNCALTFGGSITDEGGNLQYPGTTCGATIDSADDPKLDPLQDNGGPTETMALQPLSPAVDSAVLANCPTKDQRGVSRPQPPGGECDIGAFELESDTTAPTITITMPADQASYGLNQIVNADYACQEEVGGSGLASCIGDVADDSLIATSTVNGHTFTVNAEDNAGNMATATNDYFVVYSFSDFFSPIDSEPTINKAKAGQTIAVKWRLTDFNGVPIDDPASFVSLTSGSTTCDSGDPTDAIETYAGSSGLQYLGDGNWQFSWKTPKSYAGKCRVMTLDLADGATHTAQFMFT